MNILITGASGLVGRSCVTNAINESSHKVIAVTRNPQLWKNIDGVDTAHNLTSINKDIAWDLLIHAAAATPNNTEITKIEATNHKIDKELTDFLSNRCVNTVAYLSTMAIYGKIQSSSIDQNTPSNQPDGYGRSKLEGEEAVRSSGAERSLILRLPGVIGKGMPRVFFRRCHESLCSGQEITIRSRQSRFNNAVYVSDIYNTCKSFASQAENLSKTLNQHALDTMSLGDMLDAFAKRLDVVPNLRETNECVSPFLIKNDGCEKDLVTRNILCMIDAYLEREPKNASK